MDNMNLDAGRFWLCECDCGTPFLVVADAIGRDIKETPGRYAQAFAKRGIDLLMLPVVHLDDVPPGCANCGAPLALPDESKP